jgi:photosystem II stability/assembly factor-like uncharacterized protein
MRPLRILRLTILFVSVPVFGPAATAQSWSIDTTGWDTDLRAVSATHARDPQRHPAPVIWAAGSHNRLLKSTDGGIHYTRRLISTSRKLDLRGVQAIDEKTAYAMSSGPGEASRIYKTHDGGDRWKLQYTDPRPAFFLDAIVCVSEQQCFALSDPVDGKFLLVATADGQHWSELPRDRMPPALPDESAFAASGSCLSIYDRREIYFVTGHGAARLFHSPDLGRTWTVAELPLPRGKQTVGAFSVARQGNNLVVAGGDYTEDDGPERAVAYSLDGGSTWSSAARPPGGFRSAVAFFGPDTLITVGSGGEDISTDHGAHWTRTGELDLNAVTVLDGSHAWAVGPEGTVAHWVPAAR